jgi:Putative amidoligase enzyme
MRTLRFGIEIETIGQTREVVARAIQSVVGGEVRHVGMPAVYDPWKVIDRRGRTWQVVADSSLNAGRSYQAEIVSPILHYEDIAELQEIVRAVRTAGAKAHESAGIHLHVDAARFDARAVTNLVKIFHKQEALIQHALGISPNRLNTFCKSIDPSFLERLEKERPRTMEELNRAWYGYHCTNPQHYDRSRYRALNLHSLWFRGTIEYRCFNSTLHAGKVKAYIQFVLALSAKALKAKSASSKRREFNPSTARYDFRVFLLNLDMVGDEFKTARFHLLSLLEGSAAWKHGRRDRRTNQPSAPAPLPAAA